MHRKVAAAALAAVIALVAVGCGGSESEPLTRAELVSRLETACRTAQERVEQGSREGETDATAIYAAALAGQRVLVERVEGLEPPEALSDTVDTLKTELAERADLVESVAESSGAEQGRALAAANEKIQSVTRNLEAAFRRIGIEGC